MPDAHAHNALPVGAMVQEYRVLQVLGTGSFGIASTRPRTSTSMRWWPSRNSSQPTSRFAPRAHVVPLSSDTEESYAWALKHFLREAQILWNLSRPARHPNIIRVSRFHEGNGTAYMVMDFEAGESLSRRLGERDPRGEAELRSRPLTEQELAERTVPEPELRAILEPLLDGLERVHSDSVWHRDIKPANILSPMETVFNLALLPTIEEFARETYPKIDYLLVNKTFTFTIPINKSEDLLWNWFWCAKDLTTLNDNLGKLDVHFILNGENIPLTQLLELDYESTTGQQCTTYMVGVTEWTTGEHHLVITQQFKENLNNGIYNYTPGTQTFNYNVYVKP